MDTTSNEVGTNFDRDWVENAPVRRNSFFDLVAAGARLAAGRRRQRQRQRTMVYGSSYDENSFQVDGVDITDNYFNEALAEPNMDAIDEVEVLSLGAPAEYGNLTGSGLQHRDPPGHERLPRRRQFLLAGRRPHRGQQQRHQEPRRQLPRTRARDDPSASLPLEAGRVHRLHAPSSAGRSSRTSSGSSPPTRTSATPSSTSASRPRTSCSGSAT